jgi:hypothetical protein
MKRFIKSMRLFGSGGRDYYSSNGSISAVTKDHDLSSPSEEEVHETTANHNPYDTDEEKEVQEKVWEDDSACTSSSTGRRKHFGRHHRRSRSQCLTSAGMSLYPMEAGK